ncbi:hypothetical protein A3C23_01000 [Candidatus Roizmanbacteria bacterium RIFCSPHIGHO2_02_FULL_37_13b]|uniref:Queuine tRNA-ribosyltransferase n=1 Tax=Candidatus Roizmanbacteria bacterium RIFCSPLOWO2_02_FULL_36_11 TaxID=1802071 RepID=A0A1F7JIV7_9BACT|nr:MAG: hypothetical protein A3C23_01000 [Candidatus Roizmanbacteria bacterium RIFCSPHIGHO2_02_FULL_37_13b]OGK55530.1 MAG: hypothetical protein A3H78_05185 [Candidatus Roizmanbacteria bacterium RIFCSPLOWO2_02_FULL_36_11]
MNIFQFKILKQSQKSRARLGIIQTPHGEIKTPAFIPCATKGSLKSLVIEDIQKIKTQILFVNTYHLVVSCGVDIIEKAGGIHKFANLNLPLITDSGGFQVFSLSRKSRWHDRRESQTACNNESTGWEEEVTESAFSNIDFPNLVKITDDGVKFRSHIDGNEFYFTPEYSIEAQKKIGADFIVALDDCLPSDVTRKQTERSVKRTYDWAQRSLQMVSARPTIQRLYGVIQGGMYEDLRKKSAEDISSLPFWGLAIGGVAVGESKEEMRNQVKWVMDVINNDKRPCHLLGVGQLDDIVDAVKQGIDTFDCVIPTRHARMGKLYRAAQEVIDIYDAEYKYDLNPIDEDCQCYTCQNYSRAYLRHLFKARELTAYRLATIHNLTVIECFMEDIREKIESGRI